MTTYRIGSAEVTRVEELTLDLFMPERLLSGWQQDAQPIPEELRRRTLAPDGAHLRLSIHSWIVRDRGRTILIDTGAGNDKPRPHALYFDHLATDFLGRLAAVGVAPEAVDAVLLTHLHVDHTGWNTRLADGRWVPTFPRARYFFVRAEYAFFTDPANLVDRHRTSFQVQRDSVTPVVEAGLANMIEADGGEILPGFRFHATPGHTPHHASISLESGGTRALFAGDVLHHPLQVIYPELLSAFDADPAPTLASRRRMLDFAAEGDTLFFSSHFPDSGAGRVRREGGGFAWDFA